MGKFSRRQLLAGAAGAAAILPAAGVVGLASASASAKAPSTNLPSRADVLSVARRVNDHWIGAHSDPGNNQWARATYFSGNMALYRATGESRYLAYARKWAEHNNYAISGGTTTRNADNHTAGQVYYDLYDVSPSADKIKAINDAIYHMVTTQTSKVDDWWWVDALHMAMPVFVRLGKHTNNDKYLQKMFALYTHTKHTRGLYDYDNELWWRDENAKAARSPSGKLVFWSRGNGWALAAHAKVLALEPDLGTRWIELRYNMQGLARSLVKAQRSDGLFNVNLIDPAHYGGPETSGTAFFAFGLSYAIRAGILDRKTYLPVVARAWNGMVATSVHNDGYLGYVQGVGYAPQSSQPVTTNSTADFGVGGFLMAAAEVAKLTS